MRFVFSLLISCLLVACGSDGSGIDGGSDGSGCFLSSCDPDCPGKPFDGLPCAKPGHVCQYEAANYTCGSDSKWHCHPDYTGSGPCPPPDMAEAGD